MSFDKLLGSDIKGKTKQWTITVSNNDDHSVIETEYGYVDGKITKSLKKIFCGKNIGKKNETNHYEQALSEARSKWKKKTEQGFSTYIAFEKPTTTTTTTPTGTVFPMLATNFQTYEHKISYPVYIQPKLDGYRMIFNTTDKTCNSRQGKSFDAIKHTQLYKELYDIIGDIVLDGELYNHGGLFENLGILRKKKLDEKDLKIIEKIEYYVYDYVDPENPYEERYRFLKHFFFLNDFKHIRLVKTKKVGSKDDVKKNHLEFIAEGYEGSIIRTTDGKYRCKARSRDLLKFKDFQDAEYEIVNFSTEQDPVSNKNLVVWTCVNENGDEFSVRPKGTREERHKLFCRGHEFIGQRIQLKFFELTDSGIPRFPTTKSDTWHSYVRNVVE